jgi:AcrR family transcriptional regulator
VTSQPRNQPRKLLKREDRVASILAAAARAFAVGGFAATSMEDIAAEAGVTKLIVYRHFATKQELYERVLDHTRERLQETLRFRRREASPDMIGELLAAARTEPEAFALLFRHSAREPQFASYVSAFRARAVEIAERALERAVADPLLRRWVAATSFALVVEGVLQWLEHGDPARDAEIAIYLGRLAAAAVPAVTMPA